MEQPTFKLKIPPAITNYLKPDAPREARLMAARGLVPMTPNILATALTYFLSDADDEIRIAAKKSLLDMPPMLVTKVLQEPAHPKTLDFFAHERSEYPAITEPILLNPLTPDDAYVFLAERVNEAQCTIVASNQVRLLRTPAIAEGLKKNPNCLKSTLDTMVSFLRINGIVLEGESPELTPEEVKQIVEAPVPEEAEAIPEELTKEEAPGKAPSQEKKLNITLQLLEMSVAKKVKAALLGNREVRSHLIKHSNKIVASAVIKNPGISDGEVLAISQSRTVHDEIIRIIANTPDWVKNYQLQVNLANNPKTPFPVALKFTRQLQLSDLKKLIGNKNVPQQLSKLAKELYESKRK